MPKKYIIPKENKAQIVEVREIENQVPSYEEFLNSYVEEDGLIDSYYNEFEVWDSVKSYGPGNTEAVIYKKPNDRGISSYYRESNTSIVGYKNAPRSATPPPRAPSPKFFHFHASISMEHKLRVQSDRKYRPDSWRGAEQTYSSMTWDRDSFLGRNEWYSYSDIHIRDVWEAKSVLDDWEKGYLRFQAGRFMGKGYDGGCESCNRKLKNDLSRAIREYENGQNVETKSRFYV